MYCFGMAGLVLLGQLGCAGAGASGVVGRWGGEGRRVVVGNDTGLNLVRLV